VKSSSWITLLVSTLTSASVWALTPLLTNRQEPWDVEDNFYIAALLIAGAIAGAIAPKPLWAHYLGSFVGQLGYELIFLRVGPLVLIGAVLLLGYCALYSVGAALGGFIRKQIMKRFAPSS